MLFRLQGQLVASPDDGIVVVRLVFLRQIVDLTPVFWSFLDGGKIHSI
jgi:hypothetical protein